MREILFRGKPKQETDYYFFSQNWKNNCKDGFVYGSLIVSNSRYYICVSALCNIKCCVNNGITSMIEVIPETVGQYTGLTDKNCTKIFEGDIILYGLIPCVVKYDAVNARFMLYENGKYLRNGFNVDTMKLKEVIGNVHDNAELLGGANNG